MSDIISSENNKNGTNKPKRKKFLFGEKSLLSTILLILLTITSLISAYLGCHRITYNRAYSQLYDAANTVIDQITAKFQRDGATLDSIAEILSTSKAFDIDLDLEDEEAKTQAIREFSEIMEGDLAKIKPLQKMVNLRIYVAPGLYFLPDAGLPYKEISEQEYRGIETYLDRDRTQEGSSYKSFVTSRFESERSNMKGEQIIGQYVPVVKDDEIVGALCGITVLTEFPSILRVSNIYNGHADVAIVDIQSKNDSKDPTKQYEMIMDTLHSKDADGNQIEGFELGYFSDFADHKVRGWDSMESFQQDVVNGNWGNAEIWSNSKKEWLYILYGPVKDGIVDRWSVMISVPKSIAFSNVNSVQIVFVVIGSIMAVALMVYFLWMRKIAKETVKKSVEKAVLEERLHKAEAAERAKTVFLSNMSHDIRTPMNAILGFTALAEANIDNKDKLQDYLTKILSSGNHLLSLINDILDMSRIESGKLNIEEKPCNISDIFRDMRNIIQTQMKSKQLNFFMDTLDVTDEDIYCDKLHINQVLLNLLSNSIKFTPAGGSVSLTIKQKPSAPKGYGSYELRVKDTGIGMSKEFAEHIFEPFERERTSTVSGIQGTGLGMAITKNIVDTMGGTIKVETEQGKGTEFIVNLQFRLQTEHHRTYAIEELKDLRALVVDDNFTTCDSISKMLMQIGMKAEWTMYGKEAVLRAQQSIDIGEPFAAYIIDWIMPDLGGFEIVRQIRKIAGDDTPIIVVTAYDVTAIMDEAKDIGVTAYCNKPVFMSDLRDTLISCIEKPEPKTAAPIEDETKKKLEGKSLLLVEDNELNREIAQEILKEAGFKVDLAEDGTVAVEKVKSAEPGKYDLILMDIQMPTMNGYDATMAIRALDSENSNVPIVAMTANAFDEDRKRAKDCGMNAHVAKPIDINKLMKTLKKLLLPEEGGEEEDE